MDTSRIGATVIGTAVFYMLGKYAKSYHKDLTALPYIAAAIAAVAIYTQWPTITTAPTKPTTQVQAISTP